MMRSIFKTCCGRGLKNKNKKPRLCIFTSFFFFCPQMSDRGGGVPFRKTERLFSYMYSTAPRPSYGEKHRAPLVQNCTETHTFHLHTTEK